MVTHPDIHAAQQELTSVIKWEPMFSLGKAPLFEILNLLLFLINNKSRRMLLHLKQSVSDHGALWRSSLFEDWNGDRIFQVR